MFASKFGGNTPSVPSPQRHTGLVIVGVWSKEPPLPVLECARLVYYRSSDS